MPMNVHQKKNDSFCSFSCLDKCDEDEISVIHEPSHNFNMTQYHKLSLKKVIEENEKEKKKKMKKSISIQRLDKNLPTTSRSNQEEKDLVLYKKKADIQNEIQ